MIYSHHSVAEAHSHQLRNRRPAIYPGSEPVGPRLGWGSSRELRGHQRVSLAQGPAGPSSSARPAPPHRAWSKALSTTGHTVLLWRSLWAQQVGPHRTELANTEVAVAHLGPRTHQRPMTPPRMPGPGKPGPAGLQGSAAGLAEAAWASKGLGLASRGPGLTMTQRPRAAAAGTLRLSWRCRPVQPRPLEEPPRSAQGAGHSRARWTRPPACLGPRCRRLVPQALVPGAARGPQLAASAHTPGFMMHSSPRLWN